MKVRYYFTFYDVIIFNINVLTLGYDSCKLLSKSLANQILKRRLVCVQREMQTKKIEWYKKPFLVLSLYLKHTIKPNHFSRGLPQTPLTFLQNRHFYLLYNFVESTRFFPTNHNEKTLQILCTQKMQTSLFWKYKQKCYHRHAQNHWCSWGHLKVQYVASYWYRF